ARRRKGRRPRHVARPLRRLRHLDARLAARRRPRRQPLTRKGEVRGMESKHPKRVAVAVLVAVAAALLCTPAFARPAAQGLSDGAGDANGGPDVRNVTVSDAAGIVTLKLTVTGMKVAADSTGGAGFFVALDANRDGREDYGLIVGAEAAGTDW